jgi:hypothetical protein
MLDRRTFLAGTGLMTVVPTFELLPAQLGGSPAGSSSHLTFLIDGWSVADEADGPEQMSLRLGQSWRVAWR